MLGKIVLFIALSPFLILLSPIIATAYASIVIYNVGRAGRWDPWRMLQIAKRSIDNICMITRVLPLMLGVLWGYVTNSKGEGEMSLRAKKNVEYERYLEEDLQKSGQSLVVAPRTSEAKMIFLKNQMRLDVYPLLPVSGVRSNGKVRPVIVFLYGGYFDGGSKWIYSRLARQLRDHCNAVVVVPDYPTYPRGTIQEMSESVARCLMWTGENAEKYGGSRDHIWVVGHSAGAFLAAYTLLRSMMAKASGRNALPEALCAQGACDAPIKPLVGTLRYVGCMTHENSMPTGKKRKTPNIPTVMPKPSEPAVDYRMIPRVSGCVLLAGLYDLLEHLNFQKESAMERTSSMVAATGGFWDAVSVPALCQEMTNYPHIYPVHPNMCPVNGFHIVHGTTDATCPVKQSLILRDALLELQNAQNERIRHGSASSARSTPPPQLQTPVLSSLMYSKTSFNSARQTSNNSANESWTETMDGDLPMPTFLPLGSVSNSAQPLSPSSSSGAAGRLGLLNLCPHGVRHTECTHSGIVLDPMRLPAAELPYQSTMNAIFTAIYGRPARSPSDT